MRKYQKMQAIIMCGALVASSTSVLAAKEASSEAKSESATEAVSEAGESEKSGEVSYPLTLTEQTALKLQLMRSLKRLYPWDPI